MTDRAAATAGFVLAGLGLAGALAGWPGVLDPLAAGASAVALLAFALRRYGRLERGPADGAAALGGLGAFVVAVAAVVGDVGTAAAATGPAVTVIGGVGTAILAYADWRGVDRSGLLDRVSRTLTGTAIGLAGLVAIVVWTVVIGGLFRGLGGTVDPSSAAVLSSLALGLATGSVAWLYLSGTGRGLGFVDLRRPSRREAAIVVVGVLGLIGLNLAIASLFEHAGLELARHSIYDRAEEDPRMLLVSIPLTLLLIGPGEELLYRNVVQKSLYEAFSRPGAVVVASAIFAAAHVPAYSSVGSTSLSIVNTITVLFALGLVLGAAYDWTRNVLVSALIHGAFNAVAFATAYAELAG